MYRYALVLIYPVPAVLNHLKNPIRTNRWQRSTHVINGIITPQPPWVRVYQLSNYIHTDSLQLGRLKISHDTNSPEALPELAFNCWCLIFTILEVQRIWKVVRLSVDFAHRLNFLHTPNMTHSSLPMSPIRLGFTPSNRSYSAKSTSWISMSLLWAGPATHGIKVMVWHSFRLKYDFTNEYYHLPCAPW